MPEFQVTVSKGTVTYEIEADNEEQALDIADELYNGRRFEIEKLEELKNSNQKELQTMNDLVSFESNFTDSEPKNGILCQVYIDGFPADENEQGEVVAKVIKTEHNDIITVWQNNAYRTNSIVNELILQAQNDLKESRIK